MIRTAEFPSGLQLRLPDGSTLTLSPESLGQAAERLSKELEQHPDPSFVETIYRRCEHCPKNNNRGLCVQPFLPLVSTLGAYDSFTPVQAAYRAPESRHVIIADTTLQESLKYVSILAFTDYCETGLYYRPLFRNINPLSSTMDIVRIIHRELFWAVGGNRDMFRRHLAEIRLTLEGIVPNLMTKVRLLVTNDALVNAIHKMHIISDLLDNLFEEGPPGTGLPSPPP